MKTISASFNQDLSGRQSTYKCPDDLAKELDPGDIVVAEVGTKLGLVWVVKVHKIPRIAHNAPFEYKWASQLVEEQYLEVLKEGKEFEASDPWEVERY